MSGAANSRPGSCCFFPEGSSVEVHREVEGYGGGYFSATVIPDPNIKKSTSKERLFVEYRDLLTKGKSSARLREYVEASCARPAPTEKSEIEGFAPGDLVDAFYKGAWWKGVVVKVLNNNTFVVAFDSRPDVIEFGMKELRAHWDASNWRRELPEEKNEICKSSPRKRGRPRKLPINNSPHTPVTGSAQDGYVASNICARKDCDLHQTSKSPMGAESYFPNQELASNVSDSNQGRGPDLIGNADKEALNEKNGEKTEIRKNSRKRKTRTPCKFTINNTPVTGCAQNGDVASNKCARKDGDLLRTPEFLIREEASFPNQELASNESDLNQDKQLSKGRETETNVIGSTEREALIDRMKEAVEKHIVTHFPANHKQKQSNVIGAEASMPNQGTCDEPQSLPFAKTAHLWETIESMEVFKRMPQKPHFEPLRQVNEYLREGLAIGRMITFSNMAEKASSLKLNDPKSITDNILEVLFDLENHGFDVKVVRDRVKSKREHEKLTKEVHQLNDQIVGHKLEKSKIDEDMSVIRKRIRKLQEELLSATSAREKEEIQIALLQKQMQNIKESVKIVESLW